MKQFIFYKIKDSFKTVLKDEFLIVFYDLLTRKDLSEFEKSQINNLTSLINKEEFEKNLISEFSSFSNFSVNLDGEYSISHNFTDEIEILNVYENHIVLETMSSNSKFLKFISIHYPEFVIIDVDNKQISSLLLVKPL